MIRSSRFKQRTKKAALSAYELLICLLFFYFLFLLGNKVVVGISEVRPCPAVIPPCPADIIEGIVDIREGVFYGKVVTGLIVRSCVLVRTLFDKSPVISEVFFDIIEIAEFEKGIGL